MSIDPVVCDSSFYICFVDDLGRKICIKKLLSLYSFHLGDIILHEIPDNLSSDADFISSVNIINDLDYSALFKPLLGNVNIQLGEYEAIGLANDLDNNGLKYLVIDERRATKIVKKYFPNLSVKLVGTIGFLRDCCSVDKKISYNKVDDIFTIMKDSIEGNTDVNKRICSLTTSDYVPILIDTMDNLKRRFENGEL